MKFFSLMNVFLLVASFYASKIFGPAKGFSGTLAASTKPPAKGR